FCRRLPCRPLSTLFPYTTLFRSSGPFLPPPPTSDTVRRDSNGAIRQDPGEARGPRRGRGGGPRGLRHHRIRGALGRRSARRRGRSEEHTSELQSREKLVCRLLLE